MRDAHEYHPYLHENGIPRARISETVLSNRRARSISVMVLRNSHPDATRFSAALSMIEIFDLGEPCVTPIRQLPHCVVDRIRGGRPRTQGGWAEAQPTTMGRGQPRV